MSTIYRGRCWLNCASRIAASIGAAGGHTHPRLHPDSDIEMIHHMVKEAADITDALYIEKEERNAAETAQED